MQSPPNAHTRPGCADNQIHWIHGLSRAITNRCKTSCGAVWFTFFCIEYQQALMSGSHFLSWADCCSSHMRFTVSAEPDETGALIITPAFDMLSDGKNTPACTILPGLPRYTCRWFRVRAYYLQGHSSNLLVAAREDRKKSRDAIYLLGESTNTNRLCTFHFLID